MRTKRLYPDETLRQEVKTTEPVVPVTVAEPCESTPQSEEQHMASTILKVCSESKTPLLHPISKGKLTQLLSIHIKAQRGTHEKPL